MDDKIKTRVLHLRKSNIHLFLAQHHKNYEKHTSDNRDEHSNICSTTDKTNTTSGISNPIYTQD
jgi:hypothetical protein